MAALSLDPVDVDLCYQTWLINGQSRSKTATILGLTIGSVQRRLEAHRDRAIASSGTTRNGVHLPPDNPPAKTITLDEAVAKLRKVHMTLDELATACGLTHSETLDGLEAKRRDGVNLHEFGGWWSVEKAPPLRPPGVNARYEMFSDENNEYRFGFVTDNHLGSKYERLEVLHDLYDRFEKRGITQVFNAGNYIEGEARFNKFDINVHGMDAQLRYLAENYPKRAGMVTHFVAGDDHEGWYGQREGIDIGRWTERVMREHGRQDFIYLGYMEADIGLINAATEKAAIMRVVHPGGGSSYAISYSMQKILESYEGGDKPAVVLAGHYHKMEILNYRGCWSIQGGTTKDQDPFMRKKKLEAHVGGMIVTLEQDPNTGAIIRCNDMYRYFNRAYYHDTLAKRGERFSHGGPVKMRERSLGGV